MDGRENSLALQAWPLIKRLPRAIADLITPPRCLGCRQEVSESASLCASCWSKLVLISEPVCNVLGTPFAYDQGEGAVSAAALADPPPWDRARAAVAYDDASREIVHALKYGDRQEAASLMTRQMAVAGRRLLQEADIILPVPLHRWRLWQRRFNQAAMLAQALSRASGKPWSGSSLLRSRHSRSQVGLRGDERRKNVARAFIVAADEVASVAGRRVLLVDDVLTTGATASACTKVLKAAGAAHVDVLTFALVLEAKRPHIPP